MHTSCNQQSRKVKVKAIAHQIQTKAQIYANIYNLPRLLFLSKAYFCYIFTKQNNQHTQPSLYENFTHLINENKKYLLLQMQLLQFNLYFFFICIYLKKILFFSHRCKLVSFGKDLFKFELDD